MRYGREVDTLKRSMRVKGITQEKTEEAHSDPVFNAGLIHDSVHVSAWEANEPRSVAIGSIVAANKNPQNLVTLIHSTRKHRS